MRGLELLFFRQAVKCCFFNLAERNQACKSERAANEAEEEAGGEDEAKPVAEAAAPGGAKAKEAAAESKKTMEAPSSSAMPLPLLFAPAPLANGRQGSQRREQVHAFL